MDFIRQRPWHGCLGGQLIFHPFSLATLGDRSEELNCWLLLSRWIDDSYVKERTYVNFASNPVNISVTRMPSQVWHKEEKLPPITMAWKSLDRALPVPSSSAGRLKSSSKARGQLPPRRVTSSSAAHKFALKCHYSGTPEDGLSLFGLLLLACRRILSFWRWFVGSLVAKTSKTFLAVENFTLHPNFF